MSPVLAAALARAEAADADLAFDAHVARAAGRRRRGPAVQAGRP